MTEEGKKSPTEVSIVQLWTDTAKPGSVRIEGRGSEWNVLNALNVAAEQMRMQIAVKEAVVTMQNAQRILLASAADMPKNGVIK